MILDEVGSLAPDTAEAPLAERTLGLDIDGEQAVTLLAEHWLRAMKPQEGDGNG